MTLHNMLLSIAAEINKLFIRINFEKKTSYGHKICKMAHFSPKIALKIASNLQTYYKKTFCMALLTTLHSSK